MLVALWLWGLGVDNALFMGLIAFFLNFVPAFGSFIAAIPGVLLAFVLLGPGAAALAVLGYVVVNVAVSYVVEPRIMGRHLGLSPLIAVVSLLFWGWLLGPVGMLLSVPLTMALKIWLENQETTRPLAILLGPSPRQRDP